MRRTMHKETTKALRYTFKKQTTLQSHFQVNKGATKAWQCPCCNRSYGRKGDLKFHFVQKHDNQTHRFPDIVKSRSTKDKKPFPCPLQECNSGYMRKSDLKNHLVMKHAEKMGSFPELAPQEILSCRVRGCGKIFARNCTYLDHLKNRHGLGAEEAALYCGGVVEETESGSETDEGETKKCDLKFIMNQTDESVVEGNFCF